MRIISVCACMSSILGWQKGGKVDNVKDCE